MQIKSAIIVRKYSMTISGYTTFVDANFYSRLRFIWGHAVWKIGIVVKMKRHVFLFPRPESPIKGFIHSNAIAFQFVRDQ